MGERLRITAPLMDRYKWHSCRGSLTILPEESKAELAQLIGNLKRVKPTKQDGEHLVWELWVDVPKGEPSDYGDYAEMKAEGIYKSRKEFIAEWENEYPKDIYWYQVTVVTEKTYSGVWLNDSELIRQDLAEEKETAWVNADYYSFLQFLNAKVDVLLAMLREGNYNEFLEASLPYIYRIGIIDRKRLWEMDPRRREIDLENLTEEEIKEFCQFAAEDAANNNEVKERLPRLSAGKYYEICSYCYSAARYERIHGLAPKEMFVIYGDSRDGGLSKLDEKDEDEFDAWYDRPYDQKWTIENPSHMWEIREGHTHTRIHLYPHKDKKGGGYYFNLTGGSHCQTPEVSRMYIELKRRGIPVRLYQSDLIAKKLKGEDKVGIVPITTSPWQYWYGGFPIEEVLNFSTLEDVPDLDAVINAVEWFDLERLSLNEGVK